jgi:hypothetical protein
MGAVVGVMPSDPRLDDPAFFEAVRLAGDRLVSVVCGDMGTSLWAAARLREAGVVVGRRVVSELPVGQWRLELSPLMAEIKAGADPVYLKRGGR